jgi:hypothetical protein
MTLLKQGERHERPAGKHARPKILNSIDEYRIILPWEGWDKAWIYLKYYGLY